MKKIFLLLSLFSASVFAQNLISTSTWTEGGTIPPSGWTKYGSTNENSLLTESLPTGGTGLVWKVVDNDMGASNSSDGGFYSPSIQINTNKMYRFSVWIKRNYTNSNTRTYFGCQQTFNDTITQSSLSPLVNHSTTSTGSSQTPGNLTANPYFFSGTLPQVGQWYLLVGYVHPYNDASTAVLSSIYDGVTKQKIDVVGLNLGYLTDIRFPDNSQRTVPLTELKIRTFMYPNGATVDNTEDSELIYNPSIYEMNGNEPTIDQLLGINVSYSSKVAVGTYSPLGDYELAVNGEIIAKEIKVDLNGPWPDYVFENEYNLKSIEEVETYIKSNKHLPEVPSAEEVCKEGIFLGDMNAKLLKKIEELTLYVIEQNKQIKTLQVEVEELKKK